MRRPHTLCLVGQCAKRVAGCAEAAPRGRFQLRSPTGLLRRGSLRAFVAALGESRNSRIARGYIFAKPNDLSSGSSSLSCKCYLRFPALFSAFGPFFPGLAGAEIARAFWVGR